MVDRLAASPFQEEAEMALARAKVVISLPERVPPEIPLSRNDLHIISRPQWPAMDRIQQSKRMPISLTPLRCTDYCLFNYDVDYNKERAKGISHYARRLNGTLIDPFVY